MARWGSEPVTGTDTAREPLLRVRGLRREFPAGDRMVAVLQDVDLDIEQFGSVRVVKIPNVVVDHLEVPNSFSGSRIDADKTFGEQVVAQTVSTIPIIGWCAGG